MKRALAGSTIVAVFFLVTTSAGTSFAHSFAADTSLTIHKLPTGVTAPGAAVMVYGKLRATRAFCRSNMVVKLMRVRPGADLRLDTDRTDSEGSYSFRLRPQRDRTLYTKFSGFFETSYGHSHRCRASRSRNLAINVTG